MGDSENALGKKGDGKGKIAAKLEVVKRFRVGLAIKHWFATTP